MKTTFKLNPKVQINFTTDAGISIAVDMFLGPLAKWRVAETSTPVKLTQADKEELALILADYRREHVRELRYMGIIATAE